MVNLRVLFRRKPLVVNKSSGQRSHQELVKLTQKALEKAGYRTLIVGNGLGKTPDIIAMKNGELYQVESETRPPSHAKLLAKTDKQYDFALFFTGGQNGQMVVKLMEPIALRG